MTSRKRPTTREEREERSGAVRASDGRLRALRQSARPLLSAHGSVAVLPAKERSAQNTRQSATGNDVAHVSSTTTTGDARMSVRQCFGELRTALSEGWEIVSRSSRALVGHG